MKSTEPRPRKNPVLRALGCLIKVPLGCLGFLFGGAVVFVLFLPPSLGELLPDKLEEAFDDAFEGQLELGELWIASFYNRQRVEDLHLISPEGELVLEGSLSAPSLFEAEFGNYESLGPISIDIRELNLVEDERGRTGLERALAWREQGEESEQDRSGDLQIQYRRTLGQYNTSLPRSLSLELSVQRFTWQPWGRDPVVFEDLVMAIDLKRDGWQRRLDGEGQMRIQGEAAGPLMIKWHIDDLIKTHESLWSISVGAQDLSSQLLSTLFGPLGEVAVLAGERADSMDLRFSGKGLSARKVDLMLEQGEQKFSLRAGLDLERHMLVASGKKEGLSVALPASSDLARVALRSAIPLGEDFHMGPSSASLWLHFRDFELPLDGDLGGLQANCTLETQDVSFAYHEELQRDFGLKQRVQLEEPLHLCLRDGVLLYDGMNFPAKSTVIQLNGQLRLQDGQRSLQVKFDRYPEKLLKDEKGWGFWSVRED